MELPGFSTVNGLLLDPVEANDHTTVVIDEIHTLGIEGVPKRAAIDPALAAIMGQHDMAEFAGDDAVERRGELDIEKLGVLIAGLVRPGLAVINAAENRAAGTDRPDTIVAGAGQIKQGVLRRDGRGAPRGGIGAGMPELSVHVQGSEMTIAARCNLYQRGRIGKLAPNPVHPIVARRLDDAVSTDRDHDVPVLRDGLQDIVTPDRLGLFGGDGIRRLIVVAGGNRRRHEREGQGRRNRATPPKALQCV